MPITVRLGLPPVWIDRDDEVVVTGCLPTMFNCRLVGKRPKSKENAAGKVGVTDCDCGHGWGSGLDSNGRSRHRESIWVITSGRAGSSAPENALKAAAAVDPCEQNSINGRNADAGGGSLGG